MGHSEGLWAMAERQGFMGSSEAPEQQWDDSILSFLTPRSGQGPFQCILGTQPPCHTGDLGQAMGELGVGRMSGRAIAEASHCPKRASAQEGPQQGLKPGLTSLASVTSIASRDSTWLQLSPQGQKGQPG